MCKYYTYFQNIHTYVKENLLFDYIPSTFTYLKRRIFRVAVFSKGS